MVQAGTLQEAGVNREQKQLHSRHRAVLTQKCRDWCDWHITAGQGHESIWYLYRDSHRDSSNPSSPSRDEPTPPPRPDRSSPGSWVRLRAVRTGPKPAEK